MQWQCGHVRCRSLNEKGGCRQDTKMKIQSQVYILVALGVVSTDAWFWSRTGPTTLAPTQAVESEGSGNPADRGDPPAESSAKLRAEIIDEGHGFHNIVQTWNETTAAPVLTTPMQLQNENGSELEPAEISSPISKPGNGTSLFKAFGSGTGNVSKVKPEFEPELASDTESDLWSRLSSESGFGSGSETNWESGIETETSKKKQQGLVSGDYSGSDNRSIVMSREDEIKLKSQSNHRVTHREENSSGTENGKHITSSTVSFHLRFLQENSSRADAPRTIESNNSANPTQLIQNNRVGGELAAKQEVSQNQVLKSSPGLVGGLMLSPNQTLSNKPKTVISCLQTAHKNTDVPSVAKVYPLAPGRPSATTQRETTRLNDHIQTPSPTLNRTAEGSVEPGESPQCLLLDTALPFCSMTGEYFLVPNYLNHTTVAEVQVLLHNWAWLLKSRCHHSLEWFFCLLLVPKCGSLVPLLPCRRFCEVLKDSCWSLLDEGRLPVECHALPDEEDDGYQCLSVSNQKGKPWLKRILVLVFIFNQFSNLSFPIGFTTHFLLINPPSRPASALHSINKVSVPTLKEPIY